MPSEDGQLTETFKDNKYLQIQSHWKLLTFILSFSGKETSGSIKLWAIIEWLNDWRLLKW
jgi:hypothetical protein